jgi:hypothetical protein
MAKLRTLDVTDGYVRQLSEVETLRYAPFVLHCMWKWNGYYWTIALASCRRVPVLETNTGRDSQKIHQPISNTPIANNAGRA